MSQESSPEASSQQGTTAALLHNIGWLTVDEVRLPYVLRDKQKYVVVKMVEAKLLNAFSDDYPGESPIFTTYYLREDEVKVLNNWCKIIENSDSTTDTDDWQLTVKDEVVNIEEFMVFFRKVVDYYRRQHSQQNYQVVTSPVPVNPPDMTAVNSPSPRLDQSQASATSDSIYHLLEVVESGWAKVNGKLMPFVRRPGGTILAPIVFLNNYFSLPFQFSSCMTREAECDRLNEMCRNIIGHDMFSNKTKLVSLIQVCNTCKFLLEIVKLPSENQTGEPLTANEYSVDALEPRNNSLNSEIIQNSVSLDFNETTQRAAASHTPTATRAKPHQMLASVNQEPVELPLHQALIEQNSQHVFDGAHNGHQHQLVPRCGLSQDGEVSSCFPSDVLLSHVSGGAMSVAQPNTYPMPATYQHPDSYALQSRKRLNPGDSRTIGAQYTGPLNLLQASFGDRQQPVRHAAVRNSFLHDQLMESTGLASVPVFCSPGSCVNENETRQTPVVPNPCDPKAVEKTVENLVEASVHECKRMRRQKQVVSHHSECDSLMRAGTSEAVWQLQRKSSHQQAASNVNTLRAVREQSLVLVQ